MTDLWNAIVTAAGGVSTEAVLPGADAPFAVVAAKTIESQQYELRAMVSNSARTPTLIEEWIETLTAKLAEAAEADASWRMGGGLSADAAMGCILASRIARADEPGAGDCALGASVLHVSANAGSVATLAMLLVRLAVLHARLAAAGDTVAPVAAAIATPLLWRDSDGSAAVHEAAISGQTVAMVALLRAAAATLPVRADASAAALAATAAAKEQLDGERRVSLCWRRSDGASIVHCAALGGHRATMEMALRACATERVQDRAGRGALAWRMNDGASPLHVAAFVASAPCVASLLKAGADPLALAAPVGRNGARMTPLDVASSAAPAAAASASPLERARAAEVAALLQKGADSTKYLSTLEVGLFYFPLIFCPNPAHN